jgi:hypothetical protein
VADQFERLYIECADAERTRFVELLLSLATDTVKVVIGLRADFHHLALADLGEHLAAGQVALPPMSEQDLSQAITEPAGQLLRTFQPGLAQRLAADVRDRPGDLPLLLAVTGCLRSRPPCAGWRRWSRGARRRKRCSPRSPGRPAGCSWSISPSWVQYDHAQYAVEIVGTWASTGACADPGRQPTGARRAQREHWYTGRACQPGSNTPVSPVCLKFRSYTVAASPAARTARVARLGTDQASR